MENYNKKYGMTTKSVTNAKNWDIKPLKNENQKLTQLKEDLSKSMDANQLYTKSQQPKENDIVTLYCMKNMVLDESENALLIWFQYENGEIIKFWLSKKFVFGSAILNYIRIGIKESFKYGLYQYSNKFMKDEYDYETDGKTLITQLVKSGNYFTNKYDLFSLKVKSSIIK